ncbi:hypothetical protein RZS08_55795, partial [Arthrospira platensis SPKY1]|nr:hypothetical protein [Arthrospira platensis SPKY1]
GKCLRPQDLPVDQREGCVGGGPGGIGLAAKRGAQVGLAGQRLVQAAAGLVHMLAGQAHQRGQAGALCAAQFAPGQGQRAQRPCLTQGFCETGQVHQHRLGEVVL